MRKRDNFLTGEVGEEQRQESLFLFKSFNTLCIDAFFLALALYLVIVAGCLLLAMDVYGEDGVGAAAVLVHVVRPDGAILQPLLSRIFG